MIRVEFTDGPYAGQTRDLDQDAPPRRIMAAVTLFGQSDEGYYRYAGRGPAAYYTLKAKYAGAPMRAVYALEEAV